MARKRISKEQKQQQEDQGIRNDDANMAGGIQKGKWSTVNSWCWFLGYVCVTWWFLVFLYSAMPESLPQYVKVLLPDSPGVKLKNEGLKAKHPVVFIPGVVTGGLELWEGKQCADGLFRKRMWGETFGFGEGAYGFGGGFIGEVVRGISCWMEHVSLDNETGLDPAGIRVRAVSGLVAADYFCPGYSVWAVLIANLAHIGYEEKNMYMAAYDWRLSFQNTEVRDQTLSRMKSNIELMVSTNGGKKAVIVPHSMGVLYFLHFMKWVEAPAPLGGGGGPVWCARHIKAVMNIGGPFLGAPKAVAVLFSAEAKDTAIPTKFIPGFLSSDILSQYVMRTTRTWDSVMSMIPKGGGTIWGGLDWSPEKGHTCFGKKQKSSKSRGESGESSVSKTNPVNYGRIISFGKDVAEAPPSEMKNIDFRGAVKGQGVPNNTCVWTEYHDMGIGGIKAIAEYKVYTADAVIDLLHYVAPKMMARGAAHFSYGIADDLDDPMYEHHRHWSNPLETKLPNAPAMEIYSLYGVGIPTERSYVYKLADNCIPFQIFASAHGEDEESCLKGGIYYVDGDETVPVLSAGFMCAKAWRGKTRFNPSGMKTYVREYSHSLEGRGTQSGAHVDIMGNFAMIEDIMRVATGVSGSDVGHDQIHSDIIEWSERIDLEL